MHIGLIPPPPPALVHIGLIPPPPPALVHIGLMASPSLHMPHWQGTQSTLTVDEMKELDKEFPAVMPKRQSTHRLVLTVFPGLVGTQAILSPWCAPTPHPLLGPTPIQTVPGFAD